MLRCRSIVFTVILVSCRIAVAQNIDCGQPPTMPMASSEAERLKGDLEGKAQFLLRSLGSGQFSGALEAEKNTIYQSGNSAVAQWQTAYLGYLFCKAVVSAPNLTPQQKFEYIMAFQTKIPIPPPPAPGGPCRDGERSTGWLVRFSTREAGGGAHRDLGDRKVVVSTPAAIDVRQFLPRDLSSRNVFVEMTAATCHNVIEPGEWIYFVKVLGAPSSYTQCMRFEMDGDGAPIGGGAMPVLAGASTAYDTSAQGQWSAGKHALGVKLGCYFQGGEFPVVTIQMKTPDGQWRQPTAGDFTVVKPYDPNRPPNEQR
jgi:hypothetical protein